jgi:DNA-directed RNA polymerase subunit K/omega
MSDYESDDNYNSASNSDSEDESVVIKSKPLFKDTGIPSKNITLGLDDGSDEEEDNDEDEDQDDTFEGGAEDDYEDDEEEVDDEDEDNEDEEDDEPENDSKNVKELKSSKDSKIKTTKPKKKVQVVMDDEDEDDDEYDTSYLQKFDKEITKNYINEFHPECLIHNYDEISKLCHVIRDGDGIIIDPFHKTIPYLTKYEKARILGQRAKQIESGAKPFINVPETIIDGYIIAELELKEKKIPFIIRRPIPGGGCEYWHLRDLEIIHF